MPKLFVALDLPAPARAEFVRLQPEAAPGLRLTDSAQMHLTLHFLGEAEVERAASALAPLAVPAFRQSFEGMGKFPSAGGSTTLWVGVRRTPELLRLHAAVAAALAVEGFRPEARPYHPHLTLARCEAGFPDLLIEEHLKTHEGFSLPDAPMESFGLFSSTLVAGVPVYTRERGFPLPRGGS